MKRTVWLCLLAFGCGETGSAPPLAERSDEIRNGQRDPRVVPLSEGQLNALGWLFQRGDAASPFCTGTLITPEVVATARHCVDGSTRGLSFGVGQLPTNPAATFEVSEVLRHPSQDAALLRLDRPADEVLAVFEPIAHNREPLGNTLIGREVEAGGFGETYDRSRFGRYFAVVELVRIRNTRITVDGRGVEGICFGDSGGPVMTINDAGDNVVLAVESTGDSSCVGRDEMVRLDVLDDWIQAFIDREPPPDECAGLDFLGRCSGQVAEWCDGGQLRQQDCGARAQLCGFVDDDTGYFCLEPGPCGAVDSAGECVDGVVTRCRFGRLAYEDCGAAGQRCAEDRSGAFCTRTPPDAGVPEPDAAPDAAPAPDAEPETPDAGLPDAMAEPDAAPAAADAAELVGQLAGGGGCQSTPGVAPWALLGLLLVRRRR